MMRHFQIFISSTIEDLQEIRESVDEELSATEIFGAIRVEKLPAVEDTSRHVCLEEVANSDAVVLILNDRYGYIPAENNPEKLSVTHLEYREAKRLKKPVFAFICEGAEPEHRLMEFIKEISDFDEGVFRKKWRSSEHLNIEVRRALLFWLARQVRQGPFNGNLKHLATELVRYPELEEIPILLDTVVSIDDALRKWFDRVLDQISLECRKSLLPSLRPTLDLEDQSHLVALRLSIRPGQQSDRLAVRISLAGREDFNYAFLPPIEFDTAQTHEGASFVAQSLLALLLIVVDDWSRSIDQLLATAGKRNATYRAQARLVGSAAYISAFNQGQKSFEIVHRLLGSQWLDEGTVSAGIIALTAAMVKFKHARARKALADAEQLALHLLTKALRRDQSSAATLYNLARLCIKNSSIALQFYEELLRADPTYDGRWYFHRDMGLIYYHLKRYLDAAYHYDLAHHLKRNDSELLRFAGDAYYYQGHWTEALIRFEKAVALEPIEQYFLDGKIDLASGRIRNGVMRDRLFRLMRNLSHFVSGIAIRLEKFGIERIARFLFLFAVRISDMNFDAERWLALYANRIGNYEEAIAYLRNSLAVIPEDPVVRLNLVVNIIFENDGQFTEEARDHAEIAIFHGGPEACSQFKLRLANTSNREELIEQFKEIFYVTRRRREEWTERRREILQPEEYGDIVHLEFRD